jgi:predicted ABC-type transport system involved in lysophospholipase L1 biosynthesis ATPase subunit
MIELRGVTAGDFREASLAIAPGQTAEIVLLSDADTDRLLDLLLGTARPDAGEVRLFGVPLAAAGEGRTLELLRRIGFVWRGGGYVSNLKVWENLLLPLWYHGDPRPADREAQVTELLGRLGMGPERLPAFLHSLPGTLGTRDRRLQIGRAHV